jgi:23S rRNA (uracil1939-C5)-methyltransferase
MERTTTIEPTVGDRLELTLGGMVPSGECSATWNGEPATVFGGIPGERVVAELVRRQRGHIAARAIEVLEASPHRVTPKCEYFWPCTGCQWQHISYEHQLELKRQWIEARLAEKPQLDGLTVLPPVPSQNTTGYRNHARFTIGPGGTLGYVNHTTRRFLRVDRCDLMHPWINEALAKLQEHASETTQLSIRYGVNTGDYLIQPKLVGWNIGLESGQKHYQESMLGRTFRVASPSFFQVNTPTAEGMVKLVGEKLQLSPDDVLVDAYAGVGVFAALLADRCKTVLAIEESSAAVKDARVNAEGIPNIEFRLGKTEDVMGTLDIVPDAVILDPSRAGCDRRALDALMKLKPKRVAYVSCEPEALARDLAILVDGPFQIDMIQPVDLFPNTHHTECIAILSLKEDAAADVGLTLASESPRRRELLKELGVDYHVEVSGVDETPDNADITPEALAEELALKKAQAVAANQDAGVVLGADTVVTLNGRIYGKPADSQEAVSMLKELRGVTHTVVTAVAIVNVNAGISKVVHDATQVTMRDYTDDEIAAFVATGIPMDKAGSYALQDTGFHPAAETSGCYTNVIGLPLCRVAELLTANGINVSPSTNRGIPESCESCTSLRNNVEQHA